MITRSDIANELRPGLNAMITTYHMYKAQWGEIFTTKASTMDREIDTEMKMLGMASIKPEGMPIAVDSMGQRYITNYIHRTVGISFAITMEAIQDNLYKSQFPQNARALKDSLDVAKETLGASILNNGFLNTFPIGDGKSLFNLNHPIDGSVISNTSAVGLDLNETSLEQAIIAIQGFKNAAGLQIKVQPKKLIVPRQLQFAADRILGSKFRTDTANNDINALVNMQMIPESYRVNQFLLNPNAWFLLTDAPESFKHFNRMSAETDVYADPFSKNVIASALERYSFGVSNFRGAYGTGLGIVGPA